MDTRGNPLAEVHQLQSAVRDLVSLSTLPAVWTGYTPERVAESLAEVLLECLALDLVYLRLYSGEDQVSEIARYRDRPEVAHRATEIGAALDPVLRTAIGDAPTHVTDPFDGGLLQVAVTQLGITGDFGVLVAGSRRVDFPTETERLLLGVGTNQAAVALQRKNVERSLREQQEWLRVTLASIGDAVITTDTRGQVTFLNPVAQRLTGWSREEALGHPLESVFRIMNERARQPADNPAKKALQEGQVAELANHTLLVSRDGTERPIDDSAAPIRGADGEVIGSILVFRDITERHQAEREAREREQRLRQSEARFRQLADAMPQMVWMARPDGYVDYYNQRWYEFTGLSEGMGGDASWTPVLHPEDLPRCLDSWHRAVQAGSLYEAEYRIRDGHSQQYRWHLGRALPVRDEAGQIVRWFGTITDIHEQTILAEQLREETRTVEIINEVGQSLAAELDLEKLVQAVTDAGTKLTAAEFGAFFYNVLDERGESYTLYTLSGVPRSAFEQFPLPRNTAVFDPTFRGEGIVRLADVTQDPRYGKSAPYYGMPEGHLPVRSYLAVPVVSRSGEVIGGLFFGHSTPEVFTERAEQMVVGIAAQAAIAIDNARLYQQTTRELTKRRRAETLLTTQKSLLEQVARGMSLSEVLSALVRMIEDQSDGALCSILLLDDEGRLRHGAAPSLPFTYNQAIDGVRIRPAAGSCGTAAYRKERVAVSDIANDPLWADYRELALSHGLRACWSTPVISTRGEVLGSVAMYYREPREPAAADIELTEIATHLAGIAIERARTEGALRQSETMLRTIINTEPECVMLVDRDGSLRLMNHAGLQMIEADSLDAVVGTGVYDFIASEHRSVFEALNHRVFQGESATLQFELIGRQGTRRWMETHAVPLRNEQGEISAHLAVAQDITERKRDEQALRQRTEELAARDREKDEFLAMLAHELRNPLAPVLNAIQVLQAAGPRDATIQRQRSIIDRQARHMARLLDDLLDVSRITQGKIELRKQPLELGALVAQAVETARPLLEQRQHQVRLIPASEPLYLAADPTRMYQIVSNLLTNAAKYTPPGGKIAVTVERVGDEARLRVADTGQGLAPEFLPRVFDLFVQGDRSVSRGDSGLGIGLTMVQRLAWLHGGRVEAHSEGVGQGSEFTVTLPLLPASTGVPEGAALSPASTVNGSGRRVLVVDDNRDGAESLADLLSLWGHETHAAFDGTSAIQAVHDRSPEVVLLDISMPGMSGYEVAQALRQSPGLDDMLLIALTGYGQEEDRRRSKEAGFDYHLTKPVDPDALRRLLDARDLS